MVDKSLSQSMVYEADDESPPFGEIVASGISADDYIARYEGHFEWVRGYVIKMSPVSSRHDDLTGYLYQLLSAYFALNPIGKIRRDPFVQRIDAIKSLRQPDLQIILKTNPGQLTETAMIGPADICIEVVSPSNAQSDYGEKFIEYEKGGVREYWLFDPSREEYRFSRLSESSVYKTILPDDDGYYRTALLPGLKFEVATLWHPDLPDFFAIGDAVRAMLAEKK